MLFKKYCCFFYCCIYVFLTNPLYAQTFNAKGISKNYFRFPLNIPMSLAANFGECRTDHFHMGLDIRTNQKENYPVYAAAAGYVSRIYINKDGFGKAIYINHPNGYTTVYAHLNSFYPALEQYVEEKQYREQQWEQDFTFTPNQFPIYKGQFIANSGNTGRSEGPHLHFEIRETKTDVNVNPMWFIDVADYIQPTISNLAWYNTNQSIYQQKPSFISIKKTKEGYTSMDSIVEIPATHIWFGIIAKDKSNTSSFNYGIYKASLQEDSNMISEFKLDRISYDSTRYINAAIDYTYKVQTGKYIQYLFLITGNYLPYFTTLNNKGTINLEDDSIHNVTITVQDFNGNTQNINLKVKRKFAEQNYFPSSENLLTHITLIPDKEGELKQPNIQAIFPKNALYDTLYLTLKTTTSYNNYAISDVFSLSSPTVPLHTDIDIKIKPNRIPSAAEKDKIIVQYLSDKKPTAIKPSWLNNWATIQYNKLGDFQLLIDTISPQINIIGIKDSSNISLTKKIIIKSTDGEGDIKHFNAFLDDKWLMFSRKRDYFTYNLDDHCLPGYHIFTCSVEDIAGNTTTKSIVFFRDDEDVLKQNLSHKKSTQLKEKNKKNRNNKKRK